MNPLRRTRTNKGPSHTSRQSLADAYSHSAQAVDSVFNSHLQAGHLDTDRRMMNASQMNLEVNNGTTGESASANDLVEHTPRRRTAPTTQSIVLDQNQGSQLDRSDSLYDRSQPSSSKMMSPNHMKNTSIGILAQSPIHQAKTTRMSAKLPSELEKMVQKKQIHLDII